MTASVPDGLPPVFADLLRELQEMNARLDAEIAQDADRFARADAERAEAARDGRLGDDWQDVQERIDQGRTSLQDVFSGADDSPAARALREVSRRRLRETVDEWEQVDAEDDPAAEPSPRVVVGGAAADSDRHRQQLARRIREELGR